MSKTGRDDQVNIRLTVDEMATLLARAKARGEPLSTYVRRKALEGDELAARVARLEALIAKEAQSEQA